MFGPHWLVGPVYTEGVKTRSIYLPALPANETWVYYFNYSEVGSAGGRFEMATPIGEFPLFFIRPAAPPPPPPPPPHPATYYYSKQRDDMVLCDNDVCDQDNGPNEAGGYVTQGAAGLALSSQRPSGTGAVQIFLHYSAKWQDNFVSTNSTGPDPSYANVGFGNGWGLANPPPGAGAEASLALLQTWYKQYSATSQDYATVTGYGPALKWVQDNGYTNVTSSIPVTAYLLPPPQ